MRHGYLALVAAYLLIPETSARAQGRAQAAASMDHVAISVADLARSVEFYTTLFGFKEVAAPVPNARWLTMANGVTLHIVGNRTAPSEHSRWDHLALRIADMDALIARLGARRVAWTNMAGGRTPQVRADGVRQIFVQDPDGYWIEVNDAAKAHR